VYFNGGFRQNLRKAVYSASTLIILISLILLSIYVAFQRYKLVDFGSFYASGKAVIQGNNPYDPSMPTVFGLTESRYILVNGQPVLQEYDLRSVNLNPPVLLPLAALFAAFNPWAGMLAWKIISLLLYAAGILLLLIKYPRKNAVFWALWAFSLAGVWHTIQLGQIYMPLFLLAVCAFLAQRAKRPVLVGLCIGLIAAVKPNFAVWLVLLLAARQYKAFFAGAAAAGIATILPAALYGPQVYLQWLEATRNFDGLALPANNSLPGLFVRFSTPAAGFILAAILITAVGALLWKKKVSDQRVHYLGILLSLMASPIAWTGYTVFTVPIFWLNRRSVPRLITAIMLMVPFNVIGNIFSDSYFNYIVFGWFYGWGLLLILAEQIAGLLRTDPALKLVEFSDEPDQSTIQYDPEVHSPEKQQA